MEVNWVGFHVVCQIQPSVCHTLSTRVFWAVDSMCTKFLAASPQTLLDTTGVDLKEIRIRIMSGEYLNNL